MKTSQKKQRGGSSKQGKGRSRSRQPTLMQRIVFGRPKGTSVDLEAIKGGRGKLQSSTKKTTILSQSFNGTIHTRASVNGGIESKAGGSGAPYSNINNDQERRLNNGIRRSNAQSVHDSAAITLVHGVDNLQNFNFLSNDEKFKTVLLNGYLTNEQSVCNVTRDQKRTISDVGHCLMALQKDVEDSQSGEVSYNKTVFSPFDQERDHLGRLIDSRVRPKTGTGRVRKNVRINMLKGKMIMTFKDNVPQRWIENPERLPSQSLAASQGVGGFRTLLSENKLLQTSNHDIDKERNSLYEQEQNLLSFGGDVRSQRQVLSKRDETTKEGPPDTRASQQVSYESEEDKRKRLNQMMATSDNFGVATPENKMHVRTLSLQNSAQPASPHKEQPSLASSSRFNNRFNQAAQLQQNQQQHPARKGQAASPKKKDEIRVFEGLIEGNQRASMTFDGTTTQQEMELCTNNTKEPITTAIGTHVIDNNRGYYRMYNFQNSIKTQADVRRERISLSMSRRQSLNHSILKLQGEIKDAAEGRNVIESQTKVKSPKIMADPTAAAASALVDSNSQQVVNFQSFDGSANSEIQEGFNRYHSTTPLVPEKPITISSKGTVGEFGRKAKEDKSLYVAMIARNVRRLGDSAPFANKSMRDSQSNQNVRSLKNTRRQRQPDGMNSAEIDSALVSVPTSFKIDLQLERVDQIERNKELWLEYKNRRECADYSSFKVKDLPDFDIAKHEERDAVSFYATLARKMKAEKLKMPLAEYTKKLREYKSGKFEHAIFQQRH